MLSGYKTRPNMVHPQEPILVIVHPSNSRFELIAAAVQTSYCGIAPNLRSYEADLKSANPS